VSIPLDEVFLDGMRCDLCTQTNAKKCTGCGVACYCSKEHQKQDWEKNHRQVCKSIHSTCLSQIEENTIKFDRPVALMMANHVWTIHSVNKQELTILCEWLETHHSPCTLSAGCDGEKTRFLPGTRDARCTSCKVEKLSFCRSCTMINSCKSCHQDFHKEKCDETRNILNNLVKHLHYRQNLFK
jgi:hypothetical protein